MSGLFRFIGALLAPIFALLNKIRRLLVAILAIGVPVWIYGVHRERTRLQHRE